MHFINLSGYLAASVQIKPVDQLNITHCFISLRLSVCLSVSHCVRLVMMTTTQGITGSITDIDDTGKPNHLHNELLYSCMCNAVF